MILDAAVRLSFYVPVCPRLPVILCSDWVVVTTVNIRQTPAPGLAQSDGGWGPTQTWAWPDTVRCYNILKRNTDKHSF